MVNERALVQAFQQIKQEFRSLRDDLDKFHQQLQAVHAAPHPVSNGFAATDEVKLLQERVERLNAAEEELSFEEWDKQMKDNLKKNPIKEVDEFISDADTEELAEEYY